MTLKWIAPQLRVESRMNQANRPTTVRTRQSVKCQESIPKMNVRLVAFLLLCVSTSALGRGPGGDPEVITNVVEILPYVERFGRSLDLDLPHPLTTNNVSEFRHDKHFDDSGVRIGKEWSFAFDGRNRVIEDFTDLKHSMTELWKPEDIKPLLKPSEVSQQEAVQLAWKYLNRLGYTKDNLPILAPKIKTWAGCQ